jgi:hypothetical protein
MLSPIDPRRSYHRPIVRDGKNGHCNCIFYVCGCLCVSVCLRVFVCVSVWACAGAELSSVCWCVHPSRWWRWGTQTLGVFAGLYVGTTVTTRTLLPAVRTHHPLGLLRSPLLAPVTSAGKRAVARAETATMVLDRCAAFVWGPVTVLCLVAQAADALIARSWSPWYGPLPRCAPITCSLFIMHR